MMRTRDIEAHIRHTPEPRFYLFDEIKSLKRILRQEKRRLWRRVRYANQRSEIEQDPAMKKAIIETEKQIITFYKTKYADMVFHNKEVRFDPSRAASLNGRDGFSIIN
jgi:hypothetical protein